MFPSANHSFSSSDPSNLQHGMLSGGPGQSQPFHQNSDGSMLYGEEYDASQQPNGGVMGYGGQGSYEGYPQGYPQGQYGASMSQNGYGPSQNENRQAQGPEGPPWYQQGPGSQAIPQDQ